MTKSTTFGTWLKTHIKRNDDLGALAAEFYCLKRIQDFREEAGRCEDCTFHFKDIKEPSHLYWMIRACNRLFTPHERYERIAHLAAKQYSRYRRNLPVQFEVFDPITDDQLIKAVKEIGA